MPKIDAKPAMMPTLADVMRELGMLRRAVQQLAYQAAMLAKETGIRPNMVRTSTGQFRLPQAKERGRDRWGLRLLSGADLLTLQAALSRELNSRALVPSDFSARSARTRKPRSSPRKGRAA